MERTVCELFAGVGGFRCGLNSIRDIEDARKPGKWDTVWFSQWEPADKKVQWAHDCYVNRFGQCLDLNGEDTTNNDNGIGEISSGFSFGFENAGVMKDGIIYTIKTAPDYSGAQITLGDIMEDGDVDEQFFIPKERLYYTTPGIAHSDETKGRLSDEAHKTWQYIKGAKKLPRKAANGHEYVFSEGPVAMVDEYDKPARTILTNEGSFSRTTHIVRDKKTGNIRLLTPIELERIQGFPSDWTAECLVDGEKISMPVNKRRFMMGNALVVNLVNQMEKQLSEIFEIERR